MIRPLLRAVELVVASTALLAISSPAPAAAISHSPVSEKNKNVELILIKGTLTSGDEEKFRTLSVTYDKALVELDSPGGALLAGIEIGKMIHLKEYYTVVAAGETCTSACALMWVAGSQRFLSPNGRVGFHASYQSNAGRNEETGLGNALVGHYLGLLNLPEKAIVFATAAPPNQIQWLTSDNMKVAGMDFREFDDLPAPPPLVRMQAPTPPVAVASDVSQPGWVLVGATDTVKHYMKQSEIFPVGEYQAAWTLVDHTKDSTVTYYSSKDLWYYDCKSRRMALKSWVDYDKKGAIVDNNENRDGELDWKTIVPGSVGESKFEVVCK